MQLGPTSPGYASFACSALLSPLLTGIHHRGGWLAFLAPRFIFAPALPAHGMTPGAVLSQLWLHDVRQLGLPIHGIAAASDAAHELHGLAAELCARTCARPDHDADADAGPRAAARVLFCAALMTIVTSVFMQQVHAHPVQMQQVRMQPVQMQQVRMEPMRQVQMVQIPQPVQQVVMQPMPREVRLSPMPVQMVPIPQPVQQVPVTWEPIRAPSPIPVPVQEPEIVYVDKVVEVPVEVKKYVEVEVPVEVTRTVEVEKIVYKKNKKYVDKPVEVTRTVEVPVPYERVVHVEVPVERIVYRDVPVPVQSGEERLVTKEVQVPVEVVREVPVPVETIIYREVQVPVEVGMRQETRVLGQGQVISTETRRGSAMTPEHQRSHLDHAAYNAENRPTGDISLYKRAPPSPQRSVAPVGALKDNSLVNA